MSQPVKFYDGNVARELGGQYVDAGAKAGQKSGRWYFPVGASATELVLVQNRLYFVPVLLHRRRIPSQIGVYVSTAGGVGTVFRFGIYADNEGDPATLLEQGSMGVAAATGTKFAALTQPRDPGMYWLGLVQQGDATGAGVRSTSIASPLVGAIGAAGGSPGYHYAGTVAGALSSITAGSVNESPTVPAIGLKL